MSIRKNKTKEGLKIKISETLTKHDVSEYCDKLLTYIMEEGDLFINLQDVSDCDTTGLQLLFALKKTGELSERQTIFETMSSAIIYAAEKNGVNINNLQQNT